MNKISWLVWLVGWGITQQVGASVKSVEFSNPYQVGEVYMGIRLRGTVELLGEVIDGFKVTELSGLAWDEDEGLLYAISDKGYLFHLQPVIENNVLTNVRSVAAYIFTTKKGKRFWLRDSEGLAILNGHNGQRGDSQLVVSFERRPWIVRMTPQGKVSKIYRLPKILQEVQNYSGGNNAMLEAVTVHPKWGVLTAPEKPLKGNHQVVIYSLAGQQWSFPLHSAPNSAVVALETLEDGSLLVLERAFVSVLQPLIISLRRVFLETGKVELIAEFNDSKGWHLDNFEGLTHQRGNYFFMVSDDNESQFQRTLLSYFELVDQSFH